MVNILMDTIDMELKENDNEETCKTNQGKLTFKTTVTMKCSFDLTLKVA